MDPGWSKKNRSSRDGTIAQNVPSFRGRAPRPNLKSRTVSSPSIVQDGGQSPSALSSSRSQSPPRHSKSRSNSGASKKARSPVDRHNSVLQSPLNECQKGQTSQGIPQVALAVVGTPGSGKSTFIQHALELKKLPTAAVSSKKVSLEGVVSMLRIHEFNICDVNIAVEGTLQWPHMHGEEVASHIDGTMVIYSISDASSTEMIPSFLRACSKRAMPTVLVCSKFDVAPKLRQVDSQTTEQLRNGIVGNMQVYQTSTKAPDSHKRCLSFMLRNIGPRKTETSRVASGTNRPRASTDVRLGSATTRRASAIRSKHQRVQSDYPKKLSRADMAPSFDKQTHGHKQSVSPAIDTESQSPSSSNHVQHETAQRGSLERTPCHLGRPSFAQARGEGDANDDCGPDLQHEQLVQASVLLGESTPKSDDVNNSDDTLKNAGVGFDELVDRLLANTVSKTDLRFAAIFLCLYRTFSAPSDLLTAIISRFGNVDAGGTQQATRSAAQVRYLGVLAQWVSEYPGDFAHPMTRLRMKDFINGLAGHRTFSIVIKEIMLYLEVVSQDDDTAWACSDVTRSMTNTADTSPNLSSIQSTSSTPNAECSIQKITNSESGSPAHPLERMFVTSSIASGAGKSSTQSLSTAQGQSALETARSQARRLIPYPRTTLCKVHWHLFMRISDEEIAQELTRIDWIMFSSIRPRDFVRHVSLPEANREKCKSLENVTRMIQQFNHVAFWIANIILLRDKPKHRAKALEKCMAIAWLNNYNSLGAVVAGINGTAVHRLYQTRELVPHHVQKQFMRLEILMGTQKSHFAYRLAWSNTSTERIPFLPLHSRDLASAEEGNPTYIGEGCNSINWEKFEVMGEVVVSIQRSQATSYSNITRNEEVQRLILDSRFTKDDD
ncbi:MAG: hypothetical protein LQ349_008161, partial [Xanthoria aureola]